MILETLAAALSDPTIADDRFLLVGHTDALGGDAYNKMLSRQRAAAVKSFLAEHGVDPARLSALGCGEARLADPSDPESGENRRVEIVNAGASVN